MFKHTLILIVSFFTLHISQICAQVQDTSVLKSINTYRTYHVLPQQSELGKLAKELFISYQFKLPQKDSLRIAFYDLNGPFNDADSATYLFIRGCDPYMNHDYIDALPDLKRSEFLFRKNNMIQASMTPKIYLANIRYYQKDIQGAFDEFREIYEHESTNIFYKYKMAHNLGALSMELENDVFIGPSCPEKDALLEKIENYFGYAVEKSEEIGNLRGKAKTLSVWINALFEKDDYETASELIDESLAIAHVYKDKSEIAFTQIKQTVILEKLGKTEEALKIIDASIKHFIEVENFAQQIHAMSRKAGILENLERFKEVSVIREDILEINKKHLTSQLSDATAKYEEQYDATEKELTIKKQEITIANRTRLIILAISATLAMLLIFLGLRQRQKRLAENEKNELIIQSKQENLTAIINAQEDERKRIAKDLHDGIVQQLGGLKLGFQKALAQDDPNSQKLLTVLDESANELRELSHRMMPKALSELGLIPALEDMLENSLGHTEMTYEFEHFGIHERASENKEIAIYRIAQELINNVIKHSNATKVSVQLFKANTNLVFTVEDNGKGINPSAKSKGIGLRNISSRLDSVNGNVNFEPSPESGTLVTIKVPL